MNYSKGHAVHRFLASFDEQQLKAGDESGIF
jgi:hypothetical protein